MSDNSHKKTIFPAFGIAGWYAIYNTQLTLSPRSSSSAPNQKVSDFYRAASTLLLRFLKNGFTSKLDENDIGVQSHLTPSHEFSMYFYLPPESSLNSEQFVVTMQPFISELLRVMSHDDFPNIQLIEGGPDDCKVYILRSSTVLDMLRLSERVLAPYDMFLRRSFLAAQGLSLANGFRLDALYDLPRVRTLASFAMGKTSEIDGLHLTH